MHEAEWIFLLLALFYGWESLRWMPAQTVGFRRFGTGSWKPIYPGRLLGRDTGGFVIGDFLPAVPHLVSGCDWPYSVDETGLVGWTASTGLADPAVPRFSMRHIPWSDKLQWECRRNTLLEGGHPFAWFASMDECQRHHARLIQWSQTTDSTDRSTLVESWTDSLFDQKKAETRWKRGVEESRRLILPVSSLLIWCLPLGGFSYWYLGWSRMWWWFLPGIVVVNTWVVLAYLKAHRSLHPQASESRFAEALAMSLFPPTSMRATDAITFPLLQMYHPVVLARCLLKLEDLQKFVLRHWRDLTHPRRHRIEVSAEARNIASLHAVRVQRSFKKWAESQNLLLSVPFDKTELESQSYCPRCHDEFIRLDLECPSCGLPTVPCPS